MKNKRNTRRGRAKRWAVGFSDSGCCSQYFHLKNVPFGVGVYRSDAQPGMWCVVWYAPSCRVRFATHRREAFKVAEAVVRGLR